MVMLNTPHLYCFRWPSMAIGHRCGCAAGPRRRALRLVLRAGGRAAAMAMMSGMNFGDGH
jgi:hypothetical protein